MSTLKVQAKLIALGLPLLENDGAFTLDKMLVNAGYSDNSIESVSDAYVADEVLIVVFTSYCDTVEEGELLKVLVSLGDDDNIEIDFW